MHVIAGVPLTLAWAPVWAATNTGSLCKEATEASGVHVIWAYPLNAVVTVLAVAVQPIASLVAIAAAAIFKLIALAFCCAKNFEKTMSQAARYNFDAGIWGLKARSQLIVRIFNPSFKLGKKLEDVSVIQDSHASQYATKHDASLSIFPAAPTIVALGIGAIYQETIEEPESDEHPFAPYIGGALAYPFNAIVSVLAIAVQPVLAVIGLIAAAAFKLIGCCIDDANEIAKHIFKAVIAGCTHRPEVIVRIFNPNYTLGEKLTIKDLIA